MQIDTIWQPEETTVKMKRLERIRAGESARMVSHFSQGNGFGKVMGTTQVIEPGEVETPILRENGVMVTDDIP